MMGQMHPSGHSLPSSVYTTYQSKMKAHVTNSINLRCINCFLH